MNTTANTPAPIPSVRRRLVGAGLATALLAALAACGGGATTTSASAGPETKEGTAARAALADLARPFGEVPTLGTPFDTAALAGKTVYYVPIALKVGHFPLITKNLTDALGRVGVKLYTCDGQGNPSGISSCLDQAIASKPAAVVTDYIPYEMVPTAIDRVRKSGVPVFVAGAAAPEGTEQSATFAFGDPDRQGFVLMDGIGDAVVADSDGKASVLLLSVTDSASTRRAGARAAAHLKEACPGCRLVVKEVSLSRMKDVPSLVSSALLTDPSIGYVIPQYDTYLAATTTGLQSSGKARDVRIATSGATLAAVQQVKTNDRLIAVAGVNPPYLAWTMADSVLRMLAGQRPPAEYPSLARAFTKDNIGTLDLTPEAEVSGRWFGEPGAYQKAFTGLWGVR
ncbi:sugar ABC transporter substrate-binding protein [Streptosporangium saharense]|uniref:Ribose transport system substrate-binding protein n=1 Tax=Streptosporangium saharense TaxID=1706840 RepID=A0A7W7QT81_9ACTN|nr:substrate-binding domain-containing protein [Streptosporangium saharense]MBB4919314.1 ribose transport system substrate-binding protein [Streptosporangium saharense]